MNRLPISSPPAALLWSVLAATLLNPLPAMPQSAPAPQLGQTVTTGEVVSAGRNTLVIKDDNGRYQLFVYDREIANKPAFPLGSRVRVAWSPGEEPGVQVAMAITSLEAGPTPERPATASPEVVPSEVRNLERSIERQMRRYQGGIRAGMALDPELVLVGAHVQMGPFFHPDVAFRPNIEFAFGEVTTLFALNLEGIYRLPINMRQGRWAAYVGFGPAVTFLHQNFERDDGEREIDFGDFDTDFGLNILGGIRMRSGMFLELKTSIYSRPAPTLRLIIGYNF